MNTSSPAPLHVTYVQDRDHDCWTAQVVEAKRFITQGETLEKTYQGMRALLSGFGGDLSEAPLVGRTDWSQRSDLPPDLLEDVRATADQRLALLELQFRLKRDTARTAKRMVRERGLNYRTAGQLLGLTHQRVQQIVTGSEPEFSS
jgi:predicted RNase H-like HicB family nuclease